MFTGIYGYFTNAKWMMEKRKQDFLLLFCGCIQKGKFESMNESFKNNHQY